MKTPSRFRLALVAAFGVACCAATHIAPAAGPGDAGTFVYLSAERACAPGTLQATTCFLTTPAAADKAIAALKQTGVRNVLLPSATLQEMRVIAGAVDRAGLKFYTYEGWEWQAAIRPGYPIGDFNCEIYTRNRIDAEILPLREEFPGAYAGFNFQDEPVRRDFHSLGALATCLRQHPQLAGMKIFVDLLPIYSNQTTTQTPLPPPGALTPAEYGIDCASGSIVSPTLTAAMIARYGDYLRDAADTIHPDLFASNMYVFDANLRDCAAARELIVTEGLNNLSVMARSRGLIPVAFLQNFRTASAPYLYDATSFHHHRWYADWFFVFGGRDFANFVSHDDNTIAGRPHDGMLTAGNDPRDIAGNAADTHAYTAQIQTRLSGFDHARFVAPFLSVFTGELIGWLPSPDVAAGEYGRNVDTVAMVFFARRSISQTASVPAIGLNKWWKKIERLDFVTGQWETVGTDTNTISLTLSTFPGALYRLSM